MENQYQSQKNWYHMVTLEHPAMQVSSQKSQVPKTGTYLFPVCQKQQCTHTSWTSDRITSVFAFSLPCWRLQLKPLQSNRSRPSADYVNGFCIHRHRQHPGTQRSTCAEGGEGEQDLFHHLNTLPSCSWTSLFCYCLSSKVTHIGANVHTAGKKWSRSDFFCRYATLIPFFMTVWTAQIWCMWIMGDTNWEIWLCLMISSYLPDIRLSRTQWRISWRELMPRGWMLMT